MAQSLACQHVAPASQSDDAPSSHAAPPGRPRPTPASSATTSTASAASHPRPASASRQVSAATASATAKVASSERAATRVEGPEAVGGSAGIRESAATFMGLQDSGLGRNVDGGNGIPRWRVSSCAARGPGVIPAGGDDCYARRAGMNDKRSEPRFRFELAVTLTAGRRSWRLSTHDVSYRGMFVSLDEPPRPRELVRIDTTLPEGNSLTLQGMITFVTVKDDEFGRPRGAGIQFFGSGGAEHQQWEAFVRKVWDEQHRHSAKPTPPVAHFSVVLRLRTKDTSNLEEVVASILNKGGMPFETEHPLAVGRTIALELVHPHTGEVFDVACVVRKRGEGVGVELVDVGAEAKKRLAEFVSSGAKAARRR